MLALALALAAALAPAAQQPLPLDVGKRWTYTEGGQLAAIVEVIEQRMHEHRPTRVLRVRGAALFWHTGDLWLQDDARGGLQQIGYANHYQPHGELQREVLPLLPAKLEVGARWSCEMFRAHAAERVELTVPAGTFETVRIDYERVEHLGTASDLRIWVNQDVGIVQYTRWRTSVRGQNQPKLDPQVLKLQEVIDLQRHRFAPPPQLLAKELAAAEACIATLRTAADEQLSELLDQLQRLGRGVLPLLASRHKAADTQPAFRGRLEQALARFPKLRLTAQAPKNAALGQKLDLRFRLHNDWIEPLTVLPSLDGSDSGRKPSYHIELLGPDGKQVELNLLRCGNTNPLSARDFRTLRAGEALDPFGPGTFGHMLLEVFLPEVPGRYRARLILDTTGAIPAAWESELDGPMGAGAPALLQKLPQGRFESNQVHFDVR